MYSIVDTNLVDDANTHVSLKQFPQVEKHQRVYKGAKRNQQTSRGTNEALFVNGTVLNVMIV